MWNALLEAEISRKRKKACWFRELGLIKKMENIQV